MAKADCPSGSEVGGEVESLYVAATRAMIPVTSAKISFERFHVAKHSPEGKPVPEGSRVSSVAEMARHVGGWMGQWLRGTQAAASRTLSNSISATSISEVWTSTLIAENITLRPPKRREKRVSSRLRFLLSASVVLASCTPEADVGEIVHPTPDNAPPVDAELISLDSLPRGLSPEALARWQTMRNSLRDARTTLQIGVATSDGPEAFGRIWDALVAPSGDVFILDEQAQEVRIFDSSGRFLQSIGGIGDGPAEFRYANGIELLSDGRLVVSTRSLGLKSFVWTEGGWELDQTIPVRVVPEDMCTTSGDRVFVSGWGQEGNTVIHEASTTPDRAEAPFGRGYQHDNWLLQSQMADGLVGCLAGPSRVVFAYELLPIVRSFDPDSHTISWTSRIEGFVPPQVIEGFDGQRYVTRRRSDTEDFVGGLHGLSPNLLLLQSGRVSAGSRMVVVRSFLLDAATGRGALLGSDLPILILPSSDTSPCSKTPFPESKSGSWAVRHGPTSDERRQTNGIQTVAEMAGRHEMGIVAAPTWTTHRLLPPCCGVYAASRHPCQMEHSGFGGGILPSCRYSRFRR